MNIVYIRGFQSFYLIDHFKIFVVSGGPTAATFVTLFPKFEKNWVEK